MKAYLLVVFLSLFVVSISGQGKYTTPYLEYVFKGKCLWKNNLGNYSIVSTFPSISAYCDELWNRFSATASLPFIQQTNETWGPFFEISDFTSPRNAAMLWSGSYTFTQDLTNKFTTLEETSTGYILNQLWWCPSLEGNTTLFNYTVPCIFDDPAPGHYSIGALWREASRRFASGVTGDLVVLLQSRLNSTDTSNAIPVTFRTTSIFASIELPALNPNEITAVVALYMPGDRDYLPVENCTTGTLLQLEMAVNQRFAGYNIPYYCFDDDRFLMKICTNKTNEELQDIDKGITSLSELLTWVDEFDFPTAQNYPECALGVMSYMGGFDDVVDVADPLLVDSFVQIDNLQHALSLAYQEQNDTLANVTILQHQLNETQRQLAEALKTIQELQNSSASDMKGAVVSSLYLIVVLLVSYISLLL